MNQIAKLRPSRRTLLKTGGALVVSIGAVPFDFARAAEEALVAGVQPPLTPDRLSSYIAVNADGTVSAFFGKIDMGQGVAVAIAHRNERGLGPTHRHHRRSKKILRQQKEQTELLRRIAERRDG